MVRYLSTAWFDRVRRDAEGWAAAQGWAESTETTAGRPLVLRHLVRDGPTQAAEAGTVTSEGPADSDDPASTDYDVVVGAGRAVIRHPTTGIADLTFTSDYPTAAAIASGRLSTHAALAGGKLRVAGDMGVLSRRAAEVAGLDPVPSGLRDETEF